MDDALIVNSGGPDASPPPQKSVVCALFSVGIAVFFQFVVQFGSGLVAYVLFARCTDELTLAAFGLGNTLCNLCGHFIILGMSAGLDTLASQAWGANDRRAVGLYGQRAVLIQLLFVCAPLTVAWWFAEPLLIALGQPRTVAAQVSLFARVSIPALFAKVFNVVLQKLFMACSKPRAVLYTSMLSEFTIVTLLILLIAGPIRLGLLGAAIATIASNVVQVLALILLALRDPEMRSCWPGVSPAALVGWCSYLKLGAPACFMLLAEAFSWDLVSFLTGLCNTATGSTPDPPRALLAAQGLLQSTIMVCYCVSFGVCRAGSTVIGNAVGAADVKRARKAARYCLWLGLGESGIVVGGLVLLRAPLVRLFGAPEEVSDIVRKLIPYVAGFIFADSMQMCLTGVIVGAGKQTVTGPVLVVAYWLLGLPFGAFAAFKPPWVSPRLGLLGLWLGMTLAVYLHFLSYFVLSFCGGKRGLRFAIRWERAIEEAKQRLVEEETRGRAGNPGGMLDATVEPLPAVAPPPADRVAQ